MLKRILLIKQILYLTHAAIKIAMTTFLWSFSFDQKLLIEFNRVLFLVKIVNW